MNRGCARTMQRRMPLRRPLRDRVTGSPATPGAAPSVTDGTLMNSGRIMNLRPALMFRAKVPALGRYPPPSGGSECSRPGNPASVIGSSLVVASREVFADRAAVAHPHLITPFLPLLFLLILPLLLLLLLLLLPHPASPVPCPPHRSPFVARKFCLRAAVVSLECVAPALELT